VASLAVHVRDTKCTHLFCLSSTVASFRICVGVARRAVRCARAKYNLQACPQFLKSRCFMAHVVTSPGVRSSGRDNGSSASKPDGGAGSCGRGETMIVCRWFYFMADVSG
jgi:hypothetical protein